MTLPTPSKRDPVKGLEFLAKVVTPAVVLVVLVIVIVNLAYATSTSTNAQAVRDGNEIAACRVEFSAAVTFAQDAVDDATDARDDLVFMGLVASVTGNEGLQEQLLEQAPAVATRINEARAEKAERLAAYGAAAALSAEDPDAFLDQCREKR